MQVLQSVRSGRVHFEIGLTEREVEDLLGLRDDLGRPSYPFWESEAGMNGISIEVILD